ncbi:MAG TPA: c-type cytochrome [Bryobacteraceae bacterium]|nr:c-type cytochrome [Bryobacteraceae bacterium]
MKLSAPITGIAVLALGNLLSAQTPAKAGNMVEDVFKNVQALKGITADDFMGTMGIMSAAIGFCCSECHNNAGTDKVDWAADDNPRKVRARQMVQMVQKINRESFNNRQVVTCFTCHHGRDIPQQTPTYAMIYGQGPTEPDDVLTNMGGKQTAMDVINRYLEAIGGAANADKVHSYVATGTSIGFGGFGGGGKVTIYAKSPDMRTTRIEFAKETERPDSIRMTNGKTGWVKTPLAVLSEYQVTGNELSGARVDAMMAFPAQLKTMFTNLKLATPQGISDLPGPSSQTEQEKGAGIGQDRAVDVVQGTGPGGTLTTMYFAKDTGLLLRVVRYANTPIGRIPTQMDYSDYRDVGNGVKLPFHLTFAWLDGRDSIQLDKYQINATIPAGKFDTPESLVK